MEPSILGAGTYLTTDQAHYPINVANPNGFTNPDELVEGGQLMKIRLGSASPVPAMPTPMLALFGTLLGAAGILRVRRTRSEAR